MKSIQCKTFNGRFTTRNFQFSGYSCKRFLLSQMQFRMILQNDSSRFFGTRLSLVSHKKIRYCVKKSKFPITNLGCPKDYSQPETKFELPVVGDAMSVLLMIPSLMLSHRSKRLDCENIYREPDNENKQKIISSIKWHLDWLFDHFDRLLLEIIQNFGTRN